MVKIGQRFIVTCQKCQVIPWLAFPPTTQSYLFRPLDMEHGLGMAKHGKKLKEKIHLIAPKAKQLTTKIIIGLHSSVVYQILNYEMILGFLMDTVGQH